MGRIICFANQKGGVGKTTSCVDLAAALQEKKKRVLVVDADPQGNASSGLGADKNARPALYDVLINGAALGDAIQQTPYADVLPSNARLSGATVELVDADEREYVLRHVLEPARERYDYIFIDCPPSLGLLTINALAAADAVLIPVQCEYYAMEGLTDLIRSMKLTKRSFNPELKTEGILLTMYDRRLSFSDQVAREIRKYFGTAVFQTVIPRNVRIAEAPSHSKPVQAYSRLSRGSEAYNRLAAELLRREKIMEETNNAR